MKTKALLLTLGGAPQVEQLKSGHRSATCENETLRRELESLRREVAELQQYTQRLQLERDEQRSRTDQVLPRGTSSASVFKIK